jgi:hypothetical protein
MDRLRHEVQQYNQQIDALKRRLGELTHTRDAFLKVLGEEVAPEPSPQPMKRRRRGEVRTTVTSIVADAGEHGISGNDCVRKAKERGYREDTVRSLLSREKGPGKAFIFDGEKYRLRKYGGPRSVA